MKYTASLDQLCKIMTACCLILFAGIIGVELFVMVGTGFSAITVVAFVVPVFVMIGLTIFCYLYRPAGYMVEEGNLVINRPAGDVKIALSDIVSAKQTTRDEMRFTIRTLGVGGLFGYFGQYYNKAFGSMTWYVTRRDHMIIIETRQAKKIVISPDDLGLMDRLKV